MRSPLIPRHGGRFRRRLLALIAAPTLGLSLLAATPSPAVTPDGLDETAAPDGPIEDFESLTGDAEPVAVTLITGDTVSWVDAGGGNAYVDDIKQAPRDYLVSFDQSGTQEDFYVIPDDVMPHVVDGTLDRELFNIPGLIRQGLADKATGGELPVIVTFESDRSPRGLERDADALPAASDPLAVGSLNAAGVTIDRDKAGRFRRMVLGTGDGSAVTESEDLGRGVERIRLDEMLQVDLDESVPQIGAPAAWEAGFTGEGVTVAVIDTGIDDTHPDLAGQVVAARNFAGSGEPTDDHGHGTHVASIIAGTGAASDGQYTGVAPDADLLNAKVCLPDGRCPTSWIMAGMEWATEQGADIVNMSIGTDSASDGTDPLSQLVNELSAQSGTLFVTSAGNAGGFQRIGTPAAADAALAVGAVDKSDQMASFSSRGPRIGDHAVKPEITAPGVGIVAARGAGTGLGNPVNDRYTSLNGTSMASPHVAGAAALLAQARPELSGQQLKDTLVSTAADGGHMWFEQGTGRVHVPAALDSPVYATGTVNFLNIDEQPEQEVTYTNHSDTDITLTLDMAVTDRDGKPVDGVSLSTNTLTVPAHSQAAVTVTVDTSSDFGFGPFGGVITAQADGVNLRTAIGFGRPLPTVTIEVLDSHGNRIGSDVAGDDTVALVPDTTDWEGGCCKLFFFNTRGGVASGRVEPGVYTAMTKVFEFDPATGERVRSSLLSEVEVLIESNTTITLDARDADRVEVTTPEEAVIRTPGEVRLGRNLPPGPDGSPQLFTMEAGNMHTAREGVFVTPAPTWELQPMQLWAYWVLAEPKPMFPRPDAPRPQECVRGFKELAQWCYSEAPAYIYRLAFAYETGVPVDLHEQVTPDELVKVPVRYHADQPDTIINLIDEATWWSDGMIFGHTGGQGPAGVAILAGDVATYYLAHDRITWQRTAEWDTPGGVVAENSPHDVFLAPEAGTSRSDESFHAAPLRSGAGDSRDERLDLSLPATTWHSLEFARGGPDGHQFNLPRAFLGNERGHRAGIASGRDGANLVTAETVRMWNLDTGAELPNVGTQETPLFRLAPDEATYRLVQADKIPERFADAVGPLFRTGRATTTWTFKSRPSTAWAPDGYECPSPKGESPRDRICQAQPLIQLEYDLDLDAHNQAPAGRLHKFTITAGHHSKAIDRANVVNLAVQASFDDGKTWTEARVVGKPKDTWDTGGFLPSTSPYQEFRVVLKIPPLHRTNGYVSLRVKAEDANGGTIDQTIDRAYILKESGKAAGGHRP